MSTDGQIMLTVSFAVAGETGGAEGAETPRSHTQQRRQAERSDAHTLESELHLSPEEHEDVIQKIREKEAQMDTTQETWLRGCRANTGPGKRAVAPSQADPPGEGRMCTLMRHRNLILKCTPPAPLRQSIGVSPVE